MIKYNEKKKHVQEYLLILPLLTGFLLSFHFHKKIWVFLCMYLSLRMFLSSNETTEEGSSSGHPSNTDSTRRCLVY
jgi:hypothetical protein